MPTIDQLAPATAAADTDELIVSQAGTARKITRAQVLSGVQPQLMSASGTLLGRASSGVGVPESIVVGANLSLSSGTLSATAVPFQVNTLPAGTVPAAGDMVPVGQTGINTAVTYGQFVSGISGISNIDASGLLIRPTGAKSSSRLADFAAGLLPMAGWSMSGALTLTSDPITSLQAATKAYVDGQVATSMPRTGGVLSGPLTLVSDPSTSLQAATKSYVDAQVATSIPRSGGILSGSLTLAGDPTTPLQAATKQYSDGRVLRSGDTLTGSLTLAADPTTALHAATTGYIDGQIAAALPRSGGTLTGALSLAADP